MAGPVSLVMSFALDLQEARERGWEAAGGPDAAARLAAYRSLCEALGDRADAYACPHTARVHLVREAARYYQARRACERIWEKVS
jgi:hypothetical protein